MKKTIICLTLILVYINISQAQNPQTYVNSRDETHLCGPIKIEDLQTGEYQSWFDENYVNPPLESTAKWKKNLKGTTVEIYLGTWCGDSKYWVPRFIALWDQLGLDRTQLNLISLYDDMDKYKQGPNHEEVGKKIHRVPTFIFKKDGKEYARVVESPNNDLVTDLAQIALDYPSRPNYRAASYLQDVMASTQMDSVNNDIKKHALTVYRQTKGPGELNTLGYVLLRAGKIEESLVVFKINTYLYPSHANAYDSYAEALAEAGRKEEAIEYYSKVLELDADNENALKQIENLKAG